MRGKGPIGFDPRRAWAYARREAMELRRDPIRLAFALLGPVLLMIVCGYGISFDVEHLAYAALDRDRTPQSRAYREDFQGSRYFGERPPIRDPAELDRRMRSGELKVAIEIPPGFGSDLKRDRQPEVAVWLDGALPFRAETSQGYVQGIHEGYLAELARRDPGTSPASSPAAIETRFRYNQAFKSVYAIVPGVIMLLLALIPAMLTAVGVVREKELGSITNLYATPVTRTEFLLGKQLPYVAIALLNFVTLLLLALWLFQVPVKGSLAALVVGAALYVAATTGFGLLMSTFVRTQIAAIFATAIITTLPAVQFSGLITPVAALTGGAKVIGQAFPSVYFQQISVGAFTKGLGFADLVASFVALALFVIAFFGLGLVLLKAQER